MTATSKQRIPTQLIPEAERGHLPADLSKLGFGQLFTDHMYCADYRPDTGWAGPRIMPFQPLALSPAAMVLHYAQTVFEGLKAFGGPNGSVRIFRPDRNAARLAASCERINMPPVPIEMFLDAVRTLVDIERAWVPRAPGTALYIRPTVIATESVLGVRPSKEYLFFVILCPVGSYFPEGFKPINLWVSSDHVRAVRGGTGQAKTGGNYAASLLPGQLAAKQGFSQVLYLDAIERRYVEEVGAMNVMFVVDGERIVTPALTGTILAGVTRASAIELARHLGIPVEERPIAIDEVIDGLRPGRTGPGRITEIFGTGTAASIAPVGLLRYKDADHAVGNREVGPIARKLYDGLQAIQYGRTNDPFGWVVEI